MAPARKSGGAKTAAADSGAPRAVATRDNLRSTARTARTALRSTSKDATSLAWARAQIAKYDEHGPLVGVYADGIADDVGQLTPRVSVRFIGQDWVTLNDRNEDLFEAHQFVLNLGHRVIHEWGSESAESRRTTARLLVTQGEAWVFDLSGDEPKPSWVDESDEPFFVFAPTSMKFSNNGKTATWEHPDGFKQSWKLPSQSLWRCYAPHPSNVFIPYTELQRALPHIREFISAKRRQQSDANSAALNNILRFPDGAQMVYENGEPVDPMDVDDTRQTYLEAVFDYQEIAQTESTREYHEPPPAGDFMPNPMVGDESPELVDISRNIDEQAFALETKSIENVARALRIPSKLLIEGPGSAKYDNEGMLYQAWLKVVGRYAQLTFSAWSKMWFWPRCLELIASEAVKPPAGVRLPDGLEMRVWFELNELMPTQDNFRNLVDAVRWGAIPASHLADALGTDPMVTPDDVSAYDHWLVAITGGTGDPGQGIDRRINDSDGKGKAVANEEPKSEAKTAAVDAPPVPAPPAASEELERILAQVEKAEFRAWTTIEIVGGAIIAATLESVKREMARRIPTTTRGKAVRAKSTAAQRWAEATPFERDQWGINDLESIVAESIDASRLRDALVAESEELSRSYGVEVGLKPEAAVGLFTAALVVMLAARIRKGDPSDRQPLWLISEVGLALAGATVENGRVVRNSQNEALTVTGDPVSGFTQTPVVVRLLSETAKRDGFKVLWRWKHSFYRQPDKPYHVHVELDGKLGNSRYGIDGHIPQQDVNDAYCTCAMIPEVQRNG